MPTPMPTYTGGTQTKPPKKKKGQALRKAAQRTAAPKPMSAVARENLNTRTEKRYEALTGKGGTVKGVDASDGFSRKEAKIVKRARRYQKAAGWRRRAARKYAKSPLNPLNQNAAGGGD